MFNIRRDDKPSIECVLGEHFDFLWNRSRTWRMAGREPWTGLCSSSLKLKFIIWTTDVNIGETWIPKSKKSAMIFEFKIEHEQLEYAGLVT